MCCNSFFIYLPFTVFKSYFIILGVLVHRVSYFCFKLITESDSRGEWERAGNLSILPVTPRFVRTGIRSLGGFQFNRHLGSSLQGWMSPQQSHPMSHSCGCDHRCACCGKSCGKPPSLSAPASSPPACSRTPPHGSPSGRTSRRWSLGRSKQIRWVWCCGRLCSRQSAPPGRCPWLLRPHHARPSGEDAPGRAESPAESCLQVRCLVVGRGHDAPPDPPPPTLCSQTGTGSQIWSPYPGRPPAGNETHRDTIRLIFSMQHMVTNILLCFQLHQV